MESYTNLANKLYLVDMIGELLPNATLSQLYDIYKILKG